MQRCNESFTIWRNGAPVAFVAGQLIDDKHPILKTHRHLFSEPTATASGPFVLRPAEQATADPGEARTLTPPASPPAPADGGDPFDPGEHTAPEVIEYLKGADDEERARVLAAEAEGQKRKGVLALAQPQ
jgi:hypothetical protein